MSIEQHQGKKQLVCDSCGEGHVQPNGKPALYQRDEFDVMIADAKEQGWLIVRATDGKYEHTCPDCA